MNSKLAPVDEAFQSLVNAGAINGICVCAGPKVVRSRMPFPTERIEGLAKLVDEAFQNETAKERQIDRIWLGLGAANLLAISRKGVRLIFLHVRDDDTDFLVQTGSLFLEDFGDDLIQLPEHKRLVTARVLVSAPYGETSQDHYEPQPATPATTRIPLSTRFLERQEDDDGSSKPVIPKPIVGPGLGRRKEEETDEKAEKKKKD